MYGGKGEGGVDGEVALWSGGRTGCVSEPTGPGGTGGTGPQGDEYRALDHRDL